MAQMHCATKPNAAFFIGFPYGRDEICWNAHRVYGPRRSPHMFANVNVLDTTMPKYVAEVNEGRIIETCFKYVQLMFFGKKNYPP